MNPQMIFFLNLVHKNIQEGHLDAAERILRQTQKIQSKNSEASRLFGVIAALRGDYEGALVHFDIALRIDPKNAITHSNKGNALKELNQFQLALESYERAISLDRRYAEAYNNKGNVLFILDKFEDAIESYEQAIALSPAYADAYNGRGNAFSKKGNLTKAFESCEAARGLDLSAPNILASCLSIRIKMCFWRELRNLVMALYPLGLVRGSKVHPFDFLALLDEPKAIQALTSRYMLDMHPEKDDLGAINKKIPHQKIRVGYFSGDFVNHPVSYLMAGVLEEHDRKQYEVFGFSYRRGAEDDVGMQARISQACDHFIDVGDKSDREIAALAREMEIDIAIDLGGLTFHNRPGVFAYRAAPIQINYIGYLGTMGATYYDYLIADAVIIPPSEQGSYAEKIMYLPSYQANDSQRHMSERTFTREELGLPAKGFVYCCFNNNYKITPSIFDSWARILLAVEGSVLFLYADNEEAKKNLTHEAEAREISPDRIIFAGRLARDEYLARYRVADLFLDTSPYNAGTTASDALWAGLPVLTYLGRSFSARMCGSLLNAIGLPELVASSQQDYESLAISIGRDPAKILELKGKLDENRLTTQLFNTKLFTQNIEFAYAKSYERYQSGLTPDHIY
jgi:predicted O-linked N-acetylglucosamine transferase (SPINDLY family)